MNREIERAINEEAQRYYESLHKQQINRPIEFRGLTEDGKWVYGFLSDYDTIEYKVKVTHPKSWSDTDWKSSRVIPETVGEWTGLFDTDGKKIYEGDIIKVNYFNEDFIVTFEYGSFGFGTKGIDRNTFDQFYHSDYCKVIGNIHNDKVKEQK